MVGPKKGLGSKGLGLEALINNQINELYIKPNENGVMEIDINKIEPNSLQPRQHFEEEPLEELAISIKQYGVIQPIIVKKTEDYFEIVAGERRWRAAKIAGIKKIPAIIKDYDVNTAFEVALIENLQRENLNPIEEALGYKKLQEGLQLNQEQIAQKVGKSRSLITNMMRLLNLDSRVQNFIIENKITNGHARALLAIPDNNWQFETAEKIIEDELSVRDVETLVKKESEKTNLQPKEVQKINYRKFNVSQYTAIERQLQNALGTKVKLNVKKNKGKIEIEYYSDDDLDRLIGLIKNIED